MLARIASALLLLAAVLAGARADAAEPATCRVGISVAALYDLDPAKGSFGADLWLWSLCPSPELSPLSRIKLPGARPGAEIGELRVETVAGGYYESRFVRGVFRHHWDMRRYPFDRQRLVIRIEETELGAGHLVFTVDTADSFVAKGAVAELGEWRVEGFRVVADIMQEESSYGFPEAERTRYASLEAVVELQRAGVLTFVKLTLPVFAAALFAILCLYFDPRLPGSFQNQVPILVAVLFAVIINHRRSDDLIGDVGRLTLVTEIHLATILLTILIAVLVFRDRRRAERDMPVRYLDRTAISATAAGYVALVAGLILWAAVSG